VAVNTHFDFPQIFFRHAKFIVFCRAKLRILTPNFSDRNSNRNSPAFLSETALTIAGIIFELLREDHQMGPNVVQYPDRILAADLLDIVAVSQKLALSPRTVRNLADTGRLPAPLKLGGAVRWSRIELDKWIAAGCPRVAPVGRINK
jgi:prophage regulatory protein